MFDQVYKPISQNLSENVAKNSFLYNQRYSKHLNYISIEFETGNLSSVQPFFFLSNLS